MSESRSVAPPSRALVERLLPPRPVAGCGGVTVRQADDLYAFWQEWENECGMRCTVPYWGIVWPASAVLADFVTANPGTVRGLRVLDIGCGSGLASIAAMKNGAARAMANDTDTAALYLASINAAENGVAFRTEEADLTATDAFPAADIVFAADMFYVKKDAPRLADFLSRMRRAGSRIILADACRPFTPRSGLSLLDERTVATRFDIEGVRQRTVRLFEVTGDLAGGAGG